MADNNQNKAEQYRQERKERLAKAAKANAKKMKKSVAVRSVIKKVVAIVIAAAIALGCAYGILDYTGVVNQALQLGYVGDENLSFSEYIYYYNRVFNQLYQTEQYYQYYGYNYTGYDTTKAPQDQEANYTNPTTNEEITWTEYFHNSAVEMAQMYLALSQEAEKAGIELTDADKAAIKKEIEELRESANESGKSSDEDTNAGYSLNAYLRLSYGNGINESFLKKQMEKEMLVQRYYDVKSEEFSEKYTDDEVKAVLDKDKDSYSFVDIRYYQFATEELTKEEDETDAALEARQEKADSEVKKNAQAMYDAITDESSFVAQAKKYNTTEDYDAQTSTLLKSYTKSSTEYSSLESVNSDLATWAFADSTKAGDKKLVSDEENGQYYVAYMINPKHDVKTVDVRHILFATIDTETNEALSDEEIKQAKADAEKTLKEWQAGDKTEDSFAEYATDLSDDTGSASNGGLCSTVVPGQMVAEFDAWIFDEARKEGDCEIVETDYGYHIIYFVEGSDSFADTKIRSELATDELDTLVQGYLDSEEYVIGIGPRRVKYLEEKMLERIAVSIARNNSASSSTSY